MLVYPISLDIDADRLEPQTSAARSSVTHLAVPPALVILALVIGLGCGADRPPSASPDPDAEISSERPDRVVLITIDTLRADRLGSYGAPDAHTPHLDTIAARGVRFEVAISPAPLTLPAHTTLMTGLDPPAHGVRHNAIQRLGKQVPTLAEGMQEAGYATAAVVGALVLERRFGLDRGFDHYDDRTSGRISGGTGYAERTATQVVDAALAWIQNSPDRFFLWVHFYDPHADYEPPPGFAAAFPRRPYMAEIAFVDAEVGRLLEGIRARFGDDGLLLVATSDHGESLGEHDEATHSYTIYEATQRIPLLIQGPGWPAGRTISTPVGLVDLAPTLLAAVGAAPLPEVRGLDLRALVDQDEPVERSLYMETLATRFDYGWSPLLGVRVGTHKYIRAPRPELFDLEADPKELRNRAEEDPEAVAKLDRLLEAHLAVRRHAAGGVELDAEEREWLRDLGYVVPDASVSDPFEGVDALEQIGGADPKDRMAVIREVSLAQADLENGRPAEALARLEALPEEGAAIAMQRASAALKAGLSERAEAYAKSVLLSEPERTDARLLLVRALEAQGRVEAAERVFADWPVDSAPASWVVVRAATAEIAQGRKPAALERLLYARRRDPEDTQLARLAANLLDDADRMDEALAAREMVLRSMPGSVAARNDVAWTLFVLGRDLDRALELAESAVADAGDEPALLDTLASVRWAKGDARGALDAVERGLEHASSRTRAHLLELRVELRAGLRERASGRVPL